MFQYLRAVRHLKPIQIYGQLRNRLISRTFSPSYWMKRGSRVDLGGCRWSGVHEFLPPGVQTNKADRMKNGELEFLNEPHQLGWPFDWSASCPGKLWEYNLHYFEYLFALEYDDAKALVLDWIEKHPLSRKACGWEPYPVSLRIMNWLMYFYGHHAHRTSADTGFERVLRASFSKQTEWLVYRREYHLLANHYFENAAALAMIGSCFDGRDARGWYDLGLKILRRELPEQIPGDGMHFERSPMYHSRIVYLLKSLLATKDAGLCKLIEPYERKASEALTRLCHPDRRIALLNDSAFGIYNEPTELCTLCNRTNTFALPDAGYYGASTESGHYVICDAGEIGPVYNPGHAHGDIFSFELSFFGKRMVVDSGVYNYVDSPERRYTRSTAAHNTVEIDDRDQCEFFDAFKVGRRAHPRNVVWQTTPDGFTLSGEHDGYAHLPSRALHRREFRWRHEGELEIVDTVTARNDIETVIRFHFTPECEVQKSDTSEVFLIRDGIRCRVTFSKETEPKTERYEYSSEFGKKESAAVLLLKITSKSTCVRTVISAKIE